MWSLWMLRNRRKHGEGGLSIKQAVLWVRDTSFDLWQILHPIKQPKPATDQPKWSKPCEGWIKCNLDAPFSTGNMQGVTGVVLRDDAGVFLAAQAKPYGQCMDALTVEAYACRDGMVLAEGFGVSRLCLETDCRELTGLWENRHECRSAIAPIVTELQECSRRFQGFSFSHVSRQCNKVADELAKQANGQIETVVWHEAPLRVHSLLEADCNHST
ncbi:hypothetical protein HU200_035307 [Digitaria exilis]|uniref:RNase H type-1 domain-containing protein n=1 Tax=Digitaria exilis TaxID=1010633 RepID=A0A835BR76_9POAL|nr:hypothetical protein HU200_035307 [Digitaria exilis]